MTILTHTQSQIVNGLNDRQLQAAQSITGSTLVIAGAGSGKTAVLTRRVAYLISEGVIPGNILCLTFTNKAAAEMNKRVRALLDGVGIHLPFVPIWQEDYIQNPLLCTFHSLGVRLLREFGERIGLKKEFTILDTDDQKKVIRTILKELNISEKNVQPSLISYFISQCKQELLTSRESRKLTKDFLPVFHQVYRKYEEVLRGSHAVDFDDLLLLPYVLMSQHDDILQQLRERWHHVMIDEFQDTNKAQFQLVKLLAPPQLLQTHDDRSLFVVGDDAQSIYAFRGSKIEIILNFSDEYQGSTEIILNQNYRSTQPILDLAEQVISHNPAQKKKDLFTDNPQKVDVHYYVARNERDEAEYILRKLKYLYVEEESTQAHHNNHNEEVTFMPDLGAVQELSTSAKSSASNDPISSMFDLYLDTGDYRPSGFQSYSPNSWAPSIVNWNSINKLNDVVILYRTHSQSRSIEETFLKHGVPYRLVSGTRFLDRKEIRDVLSMLKFLANGSDKVSASRFLPLVMEGVGPKTLEKILAYLEDYDYPLAPKYARMFIELLDRIQSCWKNNTTLIDLTKDLLIVTGYIRYLKGEYPIKEEFETRIENIGEIYSLMYPFDEDEGVSLPDRLNRFLAQIMLMTTQEMQEQDQTPKISLMSLHQSKGLEYETVFMVGIEDGLLPHQNSLMEPGGIEEEVRLAYVGVTRAKKHLYLISSESRIQFGQIKANPISRIFRPFLDTYIKRSR